MSNLSWNPNRSLGAEGRRVAVISGASSGLGVLFAKLLAEQGYDLLLIARREELLQQEAEDLTHQYGVVVEIMSADLAEEDALKRVELRIEAIEALEYLVNCAGFGMTGAFPSVDPEQETRMIKVHCIATMRLCRAALTSMVRRRAGKIINVASLAGFLVGEACAEYTATKAYILNFSQALQVDVRKYGIRIQALAPGFIQTDFFKTDTLKNTGMINRIPKWLWISADYVVKTSLRAINRRWFYKVVCIPSLRYKILGWLGGAWWFAPFRIFFSGGSIR